MKRAIILIIIVILVVLCLFLIVWIRNPDPHRQIQMFSEELVGINTKWSSISSRSNISEFVGQWHDADIFVYTNQIFVEGTFYECRFAVRPQTVRGSGLIAVTTNNLVIWIDDFGK